MIVEHANVHVFRIHITPENTLVPPFPNPAPILPGSEPGFETKIYYRNKSQKKIILSPREWTPIRGFPFILLKSTLPIHGIRCVAYRCLVGAFIAGTLSPSRVVSSRQTKVATYLIVVQFLPKSWAFKICVTETEEDKYFIIWFGSPICLGLFKSPLLI